MTAPRWIVQLEAGPVDESKPHIKVCIVETVDGPAIDFGFHNTLHERGPFLPSLAACHLGQALQDAAAWCGREKARREMRRLQPRPRTDQ